MLGRLVLLAALACAATTSLLPAVNAEATAARGALKVGQDEPANITATIGAPRLERIVYPSASYIAVKFADFNLPLDERVVVRSPDGSVSYSYTGRGRSDAGAFYATFIPGPEAVVEYFPSTSARNTTGVGFRVTGFARGFQRRSVASICGGVDETKPAKCFAQDAPNAPGLPLAYERARAVARLLINGDSLCTGWFIGSGGHLITNQHCITSAADASSIDIEFDAESASCATECRTQLGCKGTVVATSATFITNNAEHDYAIVKLASRAPMDTYGYLQLRRTGPVVNEQIYIPQHPQGYAKRIVSTVAGGAVARILGVNRVGDCGKDQVTYMADTEGGSSGSPVLAAKDNAVVALHHCGGCDNLGVNVRNIIADLEKKSVVIPDLVANGATTSRPPTPEPTTPEPTTPAPTPALPSAGQCAGLDNPMCESVFFCTWNALTAQCLRWWN